MAEASESQELGKRLPRADMPPTEPQQHIAEAEEDATKLVSADADMIAGNLDQGPLSASVELEVQYGLRQLRRLHLKTRLCRRQFGLSAHHQHVHAPLLQTSTMEQKSSKPNSCRRTRRLPSTRLTTAHLATPSSFRCSC